MDGATQQLSRIYLTESKDQENEANHRQRTRRMMNRFYLTKIGPRKIQELWELRLIQYTDTLAVGFRYPRCYTGDGN